MLRATLNEPIPLHALTNDGNTGLFVRVTVVDSSFGVAATLFPTHITKGLYAVNWTPVTEGHYAVLYEFFSDPGYTIAAQDYPQQGESVEVSSDKTNLLRLLALEHENTVLDNQIYDGAKRLLSARLRGYNSAVNAQAGGATGLVYEWNIVSTYDGQGRNNLFRIDRVL